MLYDIASDVDYTFWGCREYEGKKFFIEPELELHPLCPFYKPLSDIPCPHMGLCSDNYVKWDKTKYIADNNLGYEKLEELLPKDLAIKPNLTFLNADYLPDQRIMKKLLCLTNAVPLMIYGLKIRHDYERIFNYARSSIIRPVYISGSSAIPVPKDFK